VISLDTSESGEPPDRCWSGETLNALWTPLLGELLMSLVVVDKLESDSELLMDIVD